MRPSGKIRNFFTVGVGQSHGVELDLDACIKGGIDAVEDAAQHVPVGQRSERCRIARVERDVEPLHPGLRDALRMAGEVGGVGGHRQLVEAVAQPLAQFVDQRQRHGAHQRLAAGQPDLVDAAGDESVRQTYQLIEIEQLPPGQELHRLTHAIIAAQIAPIRHRKAQVPDRASEFVDQFSASHQSVTMRTGTPFEAGVFDFSS